MSYAPAEPIVKTATSINWIQNGILFSKNTGDEKITLDEAKTITSAFRKLSPVPLPLLVDLAIPKGQTREAREYFAKDPTHLETYTAVGLLISNPISKVLANFFLGLNKPDRPTKLFTNIEEAVLWLSEFKGRLDEKKIA